MLHIRKNIYNFACRPQWKPGRGQRVAGNNTFWKAFTMRLISDVQELRKF